MQASTHVARVDNTLCLLPVIRLQVPGILAPSVELLLNVWGFDSSMRVLKRLDHLAEYGEQLFGLCCRRHSRTEFVVDRFPIDMAQTEKGILLGKGLPKDRVVFLRVIFCGVVAGLRTLGGSMQENVGGVAIEMEASDIDRRTVRKTEDIVPSEDHLPAA